MAGVRGRGSDRMHIGTTLREPFIDYAKLAEAYGVKSEGPIENPEELAAAYARGIKPFYQVSHILLMLLLSQDEEIISIRFYIYSIFVMYP